MPRAKETKNISKRQSENVGVGTLRNPDDTNAPINKGWNVSQVYVPDDSVIDSYDFICAAQELSDNGPHIFTLPAMPNMFLDTSTLRVAGRGKLIYYDNATNTEKNLPLQTGAVKNYTVPKRPKITLEGAPAAADSKTQHSVQILNTATGGKDTEVATTKTNLTLTWDHPDFVTNPAKVSLVNHFPQSIWKDIEIKMNGTIMTKNTNLEYPIRAYLENLLYYTKAAQEAHMSTELWHPDTVDEEDWNVSNEDVRYDFPNTKSFQEKSLRYCNNKEFDFVISLHTELNTIDAFIYDGVNFTFTFMRNNLDFSLLAKDLETQGRYIFRLSKLDLKGRYMIPSPSIEKYLNTYISSNDARYATRRNQIYSAYLTKDLKNYSYNNIFCSDTLPDQIFMVMVETDAKNGVLNKNPWFFEHFDFQSLVLTVNQRNLPRQSLKADFDNNLFLETYRELFDNLGMENGNIGIPITPLRFKHGHSIFAWDLNHDRCAGLHNNHSVMNGIANLHVEFKQGLPFNVTMIIFGIYREYLTLDYTRIPDVQSSYGVGAANTSVFQT